MGEYENRELNVGNLGEGLFSIWCTTARLSANRSLDEDSTGWDHIVRFPYEKTTLPKDLQPAPIECKVQVKTTFSDNRRGWNIKLSALKHLVDYSYPAFIIFYQYSNKKQPELENVYLVHIDEALIKRVLKRVREEHLAENPKQLHEIKLWVSYNASHKLNELSGYSLRERIASFVPNGIIEYQREKKDLTKQVGYGENGFYFNFQANSEEIEKHFLDAALGRASSVQITDSVIKDNRFNFPNGAIEISRADTAEIEISPNVTDECELSFKASEFSPCISFDGQLLKVPKLSSQGNNLYFRAKLFAIEVYEVSDLGLKSKLHFTLDKETSLDEAIKLLKLFSEDNENIDYIFEVKLKKANRVISLRVKFHEYIKDSQLILEAVSGLKNYFDLDGNTQVTLDELFNHKMAMSVLKDIIFNNVGSLNFAIKKEYEERSVGSKFTIPYAMTAQVGPSQVGVVTLIDGERTTSTEFNVTNVEVLKSLTFHDKMPTEEQLREIADEVIQSAEPLLNSGRS